MQIFSKGNTLHEAWVNFSSKNKKKKLCLKMSAEIFTKYVRSYNSLLQLVPCCSPTCFKSNIKTNTVYPQWLEHGWLVYRRWFKLVFQSLQNSSNSSRKEIFMFFFFLFYHGIVCCVYSLESPHRGDSNEYTLNIQSLCRKSKRFS